jgi:hypothetical protein
MLISAPAKPEQLFDLFYRFSARAAREVKKFCNQQHVTGGEIVR